MWRAGARLRLQQPPGPQPLPQHPPALLLEGPHDQAHPVRRASAAAAAAAARDDVAVPDRREPVLVAAAAAGEGGLVLEDALEYFVEQAQAAPDLVRPEVSVDSGWADRRL